MMIELNAKDIEILELLQSNSDRSSTEVAEKLNMSQSPCWRRINRLEQEGIIQKKVAILNRGALGMELVALTSINLREASRQSMEHFESEVSQMDEVIECYTITGAWDYMLKIVAKDIRHYEQFVRNRLLEIPMIGQIYSNISVTEIKNTTELPLREQL